MVRSIPMNFRSKKVISLFWLLTQTFNSGDIVKLANKVDGDWWEGEIYKSKNGEVCRGWFPSNYVRIVTKKHNLVVLIPNLREYPLFAFCA